MTHLPPKPLKRTLGSFRFFLKFRSRCTTGINDTAGVVDTGGNNRNKIRLVTPYSQLEGKNLLICKLYDPKVSKQSNKNFSD
jgi:hypothetical protein